MKCMIVMHPWRVVRCALPLAGEEEEAEVEKKSHEGGRFTIRSE
jgi:hypothetical protein